MKISAIIQARTSSTRLPNKVFLPLGDEPLLWHVIDRLKHSKFINHIVVATTVNINDDIIENWADKNQIDCFRGDENNVLSRFYSCASYYESEIIVRITSDDPFKDPSLIDKAIELLLNEKLDFIYNNFPPTFPEGLDVEVFTYKTLKKSFLNCTSTYDNEHLTQFMYKNNFKKLNITNANDLSNLRWTIDTIDDYNMARKVYEKLYKKNNIFLMDDLLLLLEKHPYIKEINNNVTRSQFYK